jgi:hypothetical protein
MDNRRVALLLAVGLLGAPLSSHAFPGQKFVQKRMAIIRANRAAALRTKQMAILIAQNPQLRAVRDAKRLEYKVKHSMWDFTDVTLPLSLGGGTFISSVSQTGIEGLIVSTAVISAPLTGLAALSRHNAAKVYAHAETLAYAQAHGIELVPPALTLGQSKQ